MGRAEPTLWATPEGVALTLKRYRDLFDPKSASVLLVSNGPFDAAHGPFHDGFVHRLDEREELRRRMVQRLAPRERELLFLWYIADLSPSTVAGRLGISRMHAYRLRSGALAALCDKAAS
ncbi:MAG TPA: sigma factor-like helix-turn-helix DNA-binding protein [Actinomycetota bacterium]|nr:sigma factor-like helix-turn-helix DNA-binding protein [Actinomycetota bacterium]